MRKKKVLIVTQEMQPYTSSTEISEVSRKLPQFIQEHGLEIRILMPRFGAINERRHRLHEVVRLSGMNIIVEDDDYPLVIKVASLPEGRMQVYFLDNDDFFRRKHIFLDEQDQPFTDNADRMVFFCKGVIETVKKFGWAPDIVHCHGWMTSLVPLYMKTVYRTEPLFQHSKVVYSIYNEPMGKALEDSFLSKALINNLGAEDLKAYQNGAGVTLQRGAMMYADAVVQGSAELEGSTQDYLLHIDKPFLPYPGENYLESILEFYQSLFLEKVSE
ncbi:MAG: glycogen/starch synthase [Haliscomenobacter sp.]|nr:glycogen/starch synthase [Haliscomenobacter sp.]